MASTIQIKNSTTSGNAPSSLTTGELAINVVDGNFFYGSGSAVKQDFAVSTISASGEIEANTFKATSNVDFNGDLDVDGTTNLDAVDIDGDVQLDGTFTVGVNGNGKDVRLYGQLTNRYVTWDQSQNHLKFQDNTRLGLGSGAAEAAFDSSIIYDGSNLIIDSNTGIQLIADDNNIEFTGALTASNDISASGTITGNSLVGTVGTATQGTIDHDSLANFVANEHIDHSGVSITAGAGLTGGGTIASTRDIAVGAGTGVTVNADDIAIGQDVAITANVQFANITGSAISASGTIVANKIESNALVSHLDDPNTGLQFSSDTVIIEANNVNAAKFTSTEILLNLKTKTTLEVTSTTDGDANGDIVYFGGTTSMDVGQIYNLNGAGGWTKAQANSQANSDALLAVALGAASDTNGMLLKGMVTLDHDPGTIGDPLYLSDSTAGQASSTAPNSTNDIVRLIGYCVGSTSGQIYFNPSNDFIKHA